MSNQLAESNNFSLTGEQRDIINSNVPMLIVNAYAGSGKTTTLVEFARSKPNKSMIYLAFNKAIAEEAKKIFPINVTVKTAHGLAYQVLSPSLRRKLSKTGNVLISDVYDFLKRAYPEIDKPLAGSLIKSINAFCFSNFKNVSDSVPPDQELLIPREDYLDLLEMLWFALLSPNVRVRISHDVYLKAYQLSAPVLNYDYILLDEAQDANPAIADVVFSQGSRSRANLVLVGDQLQSIYGFRGSEDTLDKFNPDKILPLTHSFRFGEEIAAAVNSLLNINKFSHLPPVKGVGVSGAVGYVPSSESFALIARTNGGLLSRALKYAENGKSLYFVSGIKSYSFTKILDVERLMLGIKGRIRDPEIKMFGSFVECKHYAKNAGDKELKKIISMVERYPGRMSEKIDLIRSMTVDDETSADVVLTTAHKSKGLEFDNVVLANDYQTIVSSNGKLSPKNYQEELNILYVAATRAIKRLEPNRQLNNIINYGKVSVDTSIDVENQSEENFGRSFLNSGFFK